jgi:branched-chain amino acid transport system ATP-binding protein
MSLLETAMVGRPGAGLAAAVLGLPAHRGAERAARESARLALARVGLERRAHEAADALPYGDQRRLEIARALAAAPRLLLLDEPAAGLNPAETLALGALIRGIAADGTAVLLVEHDMKFVMSIADTVTVLSFGKRLFHGTPHGARTDPAVIEAYLGQHLAAKLAAS